MGPIGDFDAALFRVAAVVSLSLPVAERAAGQEASAPVEPVEIQEVPDKFFQLQDARGFFWQAAGNGALTSGETQYLQSGLNLIVDGASFAPSKGKHRGPEVEEAQPEIELEETREEVRLVRSLLFDRERGAVRVLDTVENTGGNARNVKVLLRTTFPFGWQSLHGMDGALLSSDPVLSLGKADEGMVIHFSAAEGRHDTLLLLGSGDRALQPALQASSNRRELSLEYDIEIPAGESRSLLHLISQRGIPDMTGLEESFRDLLQRGRLVRPGIAPGDFGKVVNFAREAFPEESASPTRLRSLLALNRLLDRVGVHRRGGDLLWISASNQVPGVIDESAIFRRAGAEEAETIPVSGIAAIKGGGGIGRTPLLYLRDGRVLSGNFEAENFSISPAEGGEEPSPLDLSSVNLLLLHTEAGDGISPENTGAWVEFWDGSVRPVPEGGAAALTVATPWGEEVFELPSVREVGYVSAPMPGHRVVLEDGSRLACFLPASSLRFEESGKELPAGGVRRIWREGATSLSIDEKQESWLAFDEAPESGRCERGFLLRGNNLLAASFAEPYLRIREGGTEIRVATDTIRGLHASPDSDESSGANLTVDLESGDRLVGALVAPYLHIARGEDRFAVPVERFLEYRDQSQ